MKEQIDLFTESINDAAPLAYRVRPKEISLFFGQNQLKERLKTLDYQNMPHIVFYGPPGSGKTTMAHILANESHHKLHSFNAVLAGVSELRKLIKEATADSLNGQQKAIIFIDEIHRFNKAQQDALLPHLEKGDFILFGATTENPNTTLNKAILSRVQKWPLYPLKNHEIKKLLLLHAKKYHFSEDLLNYIAKHSNGDARYALNQLEILIINAKKIENQKTETIIKEYLFSNRRYDKNDERHYDVISAFIKSVRGSDTDAAILWLAVMLDGGEDIEFIARRLIVLASEDIGNADPRALQMATSAHYSIKNIGMPEARIILAQATTYLAQAPKSNSSYLAIDKALEYVRQHPTVEVPTHLRNHHPDKKNYRYPHAFQNHWIEQKYHSTSQVFFETSLNGYEKMQSDYQSKIRKKTFDTNSQDD
ncbi:MAG: replication-associated recombination protein A [Bacteriovoracaceae bacterium]|jgi:putative ATPase|nr:hypothetical protein [Halobacteriovoraceae bacterium]MDP7320417.1 replication-associated recombination protein A [Bacteriovoracaceae bacterium]